MAGRSINTTPVEETDVMFPVECVPRNEIKLEPYTSSLVVNDEKLPGTSLYQGYLPTGPVVAFLKPRAEALRMYHILGKCNHPNLLKPLGVWECQFDKNKAYLIFEEVQGALSFDRKEEILLIENSSIWGFSDLGFKIFREIFSVVDYVNNHYQRNVGSSLDKGFIPLIPLRLNATSIFYKFTPEQELRVMVGDFLEEYPRSLLKTKKIKTLAMEHLTQFNWSKVGEYLSTICGKDANINLELKSLSEYLESETVRYDDLLWQAGIWKAIEKMSFVREIYWLMDMQRGRKKQVKLINTEKAQTLNNIKRPLQIVSGLQKFEEKTLKEESLFDSVIHLRDYLLGHYGQSYQFYKGNKDDIGTDKVTGEKFLQKTKGDYMIKLIKEIRALKWIPESPVLRDKNNYMQLFYEMKKKEKEKEEMEKAKAEAKEEIKKGKEKAKRYLKK